MVKISLKLPCLHPIPDQRRNLLSCC